MSVLQALKKFSENGILEIKDIIIFLENIYQLERHINQLKKTKPEISFYQIHLSQVMLLVVPKEEHVCTGAISSAERQWHDRNTDFALALQVSSGSGLNAPLNFSYPAIDLEKQFAELKQALCAVLTQSGIWHSITLDQLVFQENNQTDYSATECFYNELLDSLANNTTLKELTLKPLSLNNRALVEFLNKNRTLESLCIEVTAATRQAWFDLTQSLAKHPLTRLNLAQCVMNADAYAALTSLVNENYRIEIELSPPTDDTLRDSYEALQRRLDKTGLERFKEEQLSQTQLLQVAIHALEAEDAVKKSSTQELLNVQNQLQNQFHFLLINRGDLAITDSQKKTWFQAAKVLPAIYQNHPEYLKHESALVKLQVNELVTDGSRTNGYVLLGKALKTENLAALWTLLFVKVNLFEVPEGDAEPPFLVQVLQSKGGLKRAVLEHIKLDQHLVEQAKNYLVSYPQLIELVSAVKTHLDAYSGYLVQRDVPFDFLSISNEILRICRRLFGYPNPADSRGEEFAKIYLAFEKSMQVMSDSPQELNYQVLRDTQIIMQGIKENSLAASRGLMNRSVLHEEMIRLVDRFDEALEQIKGHIDQKKDETIARISVERDSEKAVFDEKYAKLQSENTDLQEKRAKKEAEYAELKTEHAELKTAHAELRTEYAQKITAMEAKQATMAAEQAQMKEMLNSLISRGNRQSPPASPSQESRFFARP